MSRMHTAPRLLAIAVIFAGSLALAACSRPTPVGGPDETEAGGEGEPVAPPPYYEDDSGGAALQPGDEGYPPPRPDAEYMPEGYPEPGEAPVDGADEGDAEGAEGAEEGDAAGAEGEEGESSEDEG